MQIGELAKLSGFSRDTLRYYEKFGLLPPDQFQIQTKKLNSYREYKDSALIRLQQIQELKEIGFTLEEIKIFLSDFDSTDPCKNLPNFFREKIQRIDDKMAVLQKFRSHLEASLNLCSNECGTNGCNDTQGIPQCITQAVQTYSP